MEIRTPQLPPGDPLMGYPRSVRLASAVTGFLRAWSLPLFFVGGTVLAFLGTIATVVIESGCNDEAYEATRGGFSIEDRGKYEEIKAACIERNGVPMGLLALLGGVFYVGVFGLLSVAIAWLGYRSRLRRHRKTLGPRMERSRESLIRGDLAEAEYRALLDVWRPLMEGTTAGLRGRMGAVALVMLGSLAALGALVGGVLTGIFASMLPRASSSDGLFGTIVFGAVTVVMAFAAVWAWVGAPRSLVRSGEDLQEEAHTAEDRETQVLAQAAARNRGRPSPVSLPEPAQPTFAPYARKRRART